MNRYRVRFPELERLARAGAFGDQGATLTFSVTFVAYDDEHALGLVEAGRVVNPDAPVVLERQGGPVGWWPVEPPPVVQ